MTPPSHGQALEALLESREFLRRLARSLVRDEAGAEDLVQETWTRALQGAPQGVGSPRAWLARVLRNLAATQGQREAARAFVERAAARSEALEEAEERDLELEDSLLAAVRTLRPPYRRAVYLRYYRDLSPPRIAELLGCPEATVKTRLRRGLELLRADLERRCGPRGLDWRRGLALLALPPVDRLALPWTALAQGSLPTLLAMNKPLASALVTLLLVVLGSVAWYALPGARAVERALDAPAAPLPTGVARSEEPALPELGEPLAPARAALRGEREARAVAPARSGAASPTGGTLVGRLLDAEGRPVAGARLEFEPRAPIEVRVGWGESGADRVAELATALSQADGRFRVPVDQEGAGDLRVRAAGYVPLHREATGYLERESELGDLVLERGVRLGGRVVDTQGRPVGGAWVRSVPPATDLPHLWGPRAVDDGVRTDGAGRFELDSLAVGPWQLEAGSELHPSASASGTTQAPGERVDDIRIVLPEGLSIRGRIRDLPADEGGELWVRAARVASEDPLPAGGIRFVLPESDWLAAERSVPVAADGTFEVPGLAQNSSVRLAAYDRPGTVGGLRRSRVLEAQAGAEGVELPFAPGASLRFEVVDAGSGRPIERFSAAVQLDPTFLLNDQVAPLAEHPGGVARLENLTLSEGREQVRARLAIHAPGYAPFARDDVPVLRDQEQDLGRIRLQPVPRLTVRVRDAQGNPVEGARVELQPFVEGSPGTQRAGTVRMRVGTLREGGSEPFRPRATRTDGDGLAQLDSAPGERVSLVVEAPRFAPERSAPFDLPLLGDVERDVTLLRGAAVEVRVLDAAGHPAVGARVQHRPAEGERDAFEPPDPFGDRTRTTDAHGVVWFRHLEAGAHGFRLAPAGGGSFVSTGGGSLRVRTSIERENGEEPWQSLVLAEGESATLELHRRRPASLEGTLTENGLPLADAELLLVEDPDDPLAGMGGFAGALAGRTDREGRFRIADVQPGEYTLLVRHATRALAHREPLEVPPGGLRHDVDLAVSVVSGRVLDTNGKPVVGARVEVERAPRKTGGAPRRMVMVAAVTAGSGGAGGQVSVHTGADHATATETDAQGRFTLRGLPSNTPLRVAARAADFAPARSAEFELEPGEERGRVDLELVRGGALRVALQGSGASLPSTILVRAQRVDGDGPVGEPRLEISDETGEVRFADLEPGRWRITATVLGPGSTSGEPTEVDVAPGEERSVPIPAP